MREAALPKRVADSRLLDLLAAVAAVLLVAAPMLFTKSGFGVDFTNHLWLAWVAGKNLVATGHPSYFLNAATVGVFEPWYAFYGGTLYTIAGGLSELLGGHPVLVYVGITILAIAGSYGGMLWLGRQVGLNRWLSHAPALVVVTSAYYVSNLYGRGAWPEFIACAAIAPLVASAVRLTRAKHWHPWTVLVFVVSTIAFTGSHNITLLWGATIGVLALVIMWLAFNSPRNLPWRRLAMVAGLGLASLLVSAWYLVPDISYAQDVKTHLETGLGEGGYSFFRAFLAPIFSYDTPAVLFNPLRHIPAGTGVPGLFVQVPDWFLAWALLAGSLLLRRRRLRESAADTSARAARRPGGRRNGRSRTLSARGGGAGPAGRSARQIAAGQRRGQLDARLPRVWIGAAALVAILLLMIMLTSFWKVVPAPFNVIQFPFRLGTYVFYAMGGLVLVSALALQRALADGRSDRTAKRLQAALIGACVISVSICLWQLWVPNTLTSTSYRNRETALASPTTPPHSWYDQGSYNDIQAPIVAAQHELQFNPSSIHGDRLSTWVNPPPGSAPIQTNIAGGSYLVHISGLTRVGRNEYGYAVVRRPNNGSGPVHVVIEAAHSGALSFAWTLSILASLAVLAILVWTTVRHWRLPREQRPL